jgi:hypothetical protein
VYRRALWLARTEFGRDHLVVATLYHNLGGLEHERGRHRRGEPFARAAIAIHEHLFGPDDPATAADVASLGAILDGQGRHREAELLDERALAALAKQLGPDHLDIASALSNLACCYTAARSSSSRRCSARPILAL